MENQRVTMKCSTRIITAIAVTIALGGMFAYQDVEKNGLAYQSHPVAAIGTDFFCGFLAALIFYFGSGWLGKRKEGKADFKDDKFYDQVANELKENTLVPGLWTKAYAEMNGDEPRARALYIRYRIKELRDKRIEIMNEQAKDARFKAKEARRAVEAAKPRLSLPVKVLNVILGTFCGLVSLFMAIVCVFVIFDLAAVVGGRSDTAIGDDVTGLLFVVGVGFVFGWVALKCLNDAAR